MDLRAAGGSGAMTPKINQSINHNLITIEEIIKYLSAFDQSSFCTKM